MSATQTAAAANELHKKHFEMLRLARLRELEARYIGGGLFKVPSFTQQKYGVHWVVNVPGMACTCPAKGYCTHLATAVNDYFVNQVSPTDYGQYIGEGAADRAHFLSRIHQGKLNRNDKTYLRYCVRFAERRMREREVVKVPPITKTTIKEGSRTRTVERVGAFTI